MDKATQKSIEWQKANYPMAIGGNAFADIVDSINVNPAFVAGYKEAEKDLALTWEDIAKINQLHFEVMSEYDPEVITPMKIHEEVLKRFNEQRKK